jgi:ATP/maltotriose-dependent transcriptional regulator MalT
VDEDLGREIEGVLRAGQLPPIEVISTTLINDILDSESRFLLVLDDFQVIQDRFILQVLSNWKTRPNRFIWSCSPARSLSASGETTSQ